MPRLPDPEIEETEDNLASLLDIEQAARTLLLRLQRAIDKQETQRILDAMERIRAREQARRARFRAAWK
jgi:hypothetical protein